MFEFLSKAIPLLGLSVLLCSPVLAQDAAFDLPPANAAPSQPKVASPMTGSAENHDNMRHWSRFSSSNARPTFVRVPAGTKVPSSAPSHYVRPQWVQAGKAPVEASQNKGPVKRYLAFNIPAGAYAKKSSTTSTNGAGSQPAPTNSAKKLAPSMKHVPTHVQILGYGRKSGEITSTYIPVTHHSARAAAFACYPRYQ